MTQVSHSSTSQQTNLFESILALITETSTNLPLDVRQALAAGALREQAGTRAALSLHTIATNNTLAKTNVSPICQDTGMPTFIVHAPVGMLHRVLTETIQQAVAQATKQGILRTNSVDSLTGENTGNNLGTGMPVVHIAQWEHETIEVKLLLKGGGCENKNTQYSLPCTLPALGAAGRDLDGVRKCVLHAVYQAQGQGCSAGFIGVGIGGDRTTGYELAKMQLFRTLDDTNEHLDLARLEAVVMDAANALGIGTMGFGGETTLLGCKVGVMNRLPASFFVSVAYNCWAFRRQGMLLDGQTGRPLQWLYPRGEEVALPTLPAAHDTQPTGRIVELTTPLTEEAVRQLKVGDIVVLSGKMYTGRDAIHKHLMEHDAPVDLHGAALYHCGPVMVEHPTGWEVRAAGPTTSAREEPYQSEVIRKCGVRAVIGKGGMGAKTLAALQQYGAVYLNAIGGAAQVYAQNVRHVDGVDFLSFGIPEAMWHLDVAGFTAVVTMDAHGNSLHADVDKTSLERLAQFEPRVFSS